MANLPHHRGVLPSVIAAAALVGWLTRAAGQPDYEQFARAGSALLHGDLSHVYADRTTQAGPLQLIVAGALHSLTQLRPGLDTTVLHVGGSVLAVCLLVWITERERTFMKLPQSSLRAPAVGVMTIALLWLARGTAFGHPAEFAIPLMWVCAGIAVLEGRPLWGGALVALSTGWEVWGLLGFSLVVLCAHRSDLIRFVAAAGAAGSVLWLPFVTSGHFAMLDMAWTIHSDTLDATLVSGQTFTGGMRLAQLVLSLLAGAAAALALRSSVAPGSRAAVWMVPLATVTVRLLLDPVQYSYYWIVPLTLVIVSCGSVVRLRSPDFLVVAGLLYVTLLGFRGAWCGALLLATLVILGVRIRQIAVSASKNTQGRKIVATPA